MNSTFNHGKKGGKNITSASLKKDAATTQKKDTSKEDFPKMDWNRLEDSMPEKRHPTMGKNIPQNPMEEEDLFLGDNLLDMGFWDDDDYYEEEDDFF